MTRRTGTGKYEQLLERCRSLEPVPTAVAHPCEETALAGAVEAGAQGADRADPRRARRRRSRGRRDGAASISAGVRIVDAPHSHAAAAKAVELVRQGEAELLMKGSLHTDELLGAVVATRDRPAHRPPHQPRLHHGRADLSQGPRRHRRGDQHRADARGQGRHLPERDRPRDLARRRRSRRSRSSPRSRPSTRRCRRRSTRRRCARWPSAGRSPAALLDGPLAFDNAISKEAARIKGIKSEVAGDPDILLVPDLEAGNILAKQLSFLANADSAGLVLGARVPIILTSRADSVRSRIASCARRDAGRARAPAAAAGDARERTSEADMDDYAVVLNAGSSSLKFCVYRRPGADRWRLEARGQIEGIGTSPRFSAKDGAGAPTRRRSAGPRRCATAARALDVARRRGCARATAARACSASAIASSTAAPRYAAPDDRHARGARRAARADPARAAASAAQPRGDRRRRRAAARRAAGGLLRHQLPSRPAGGRRARAAAARDLRAAACSATASTACRTSTSRRCCRRSRPRSPTAA